MIANEPLTRPSPSAALPMRVVAAVSLVALLSVTVALSTAEWESSTSSTGSAIHHPAEIEPQPAPAPTIDFHSSL